MASASKRFHLEPVVVNAEVVRKADFMVSKITGRISFKWIAGKLQGTDASIATTDGFVSARPAASFQRTWP